MFFAQKYYFVHIYKVMFVGVCLFLPTWCTKCYQIKSTAGNIGMFLVLWLHKSRMLSSSKLIHRTCRLRYIYMWPLIWENKQKPIRRPDINSALFAILAHDARATQWKHSNFYLPSAKSVRWEFDSVHGFRDAFCVHDTRHRQITSVCTAICANSLSLFLTCYQCQRLIVDVVQHSICIFSGCFPFAWLLFFYKYIRTPNTWYGK